MVRAGEMMGIAALNPSYMLEDQAHKKGGHWPPFFIDFICFLSCLVLTAGLAFYNLIWLIVVNEKAVLLPPPSMGLIPVIAPGHHQRRDLTATIDYSDIRGFDRMTCLHRGAVSL